MNNEETIIMQPQAVNKATEATKNTETPKKEEAPKSENKESNGKRIAATAAAGVFGGAAGGAASVAAATILGTQEQEDAVEEVQEEVVAEPVTEVKPEPVQEAKEEEIIIEPVEPEEPDYSGNNGEDPVVQEPEPQPTPTRNEDVPEVQILGVYERTTEDGVDQELVILTNGENVAGIVDTTGDGEANILAVDENENGQIEENEVYDISDQHVEMGMFEQQYLAQQQMEQEQQDALAFEASDEPDYDNDVDYTMA